MGMPLILILILVCTLSACGSEGFDIPSLAAVSVFLRLKLGTSGLSSHGTIGQRRRFQQNDPISSPMSSTPGFGWRRHEILSPPPNKAFQYSSPMHACPTKGPAQGSARKHSEKAFAPSTSSPKHAAKNSVHASAPCPPLSYYKHHRAKIKNISVPPGLSNQLSSSTYIHQGPLTSPFHSPSPSATRWSSPAHAPSPATISSPFGMPVPAPTISPFSSSIVQKATPPPSPIMTLPPPPPNEECTSLTCTDPLTYTAPGSPCGCVWPIQVSLHLTVPIYTFFPLVSELANEIASGVSLNRSQVRVMGANAASQQQEKTIVLINLVPPSTVNFNESTALFIYNSFWHKQVPIRASLFGAYEVVYIRYPGLPPSPPLVPATIDDHPYPGHGNEGMPIKPLGVDVPRKKKYGPQGSMIAVIVLSSVTAFVACMAAIWLLLFKCGCIHQSEKPPHVLISSQGKPSAGTTKSLTLGSGPSSASMSFSSSLLQYTGNAKIFSLTDMERATENFDGSRILGEGGFGLVYSGTLDDGRKVAVKVLKRDDHQGSREFLAEVEMLSRLHHRNLVKLFGICTEDHIHCLVYELVPNGSVESHLHGVDKEAAPLNWGARMKIALGAARGLAYLHEDSSPPVIHRDFKSSNILLEHDFTPKVSDFGLARTALDEENKHISTHVMGTFGYLAPEYAMTGHLLVKSDVYSYGVVLLELLSGRKPIDLSQPSGQENLVAWARPLLSSKEGLEKIIDPSLKPNIPFDSAVKVAAIASMCVQPEVSNRPFMGEVVQALKLVCNEFDETKEPVSASCSHEDLSIDVDNKVSSKVSGELVEVSRTGDPIPGYHSLFDSEVALSASFQGEEFGSFRRHANSAPLRMGRGRRFWQRLRGTSSGSMSEHGFH